MNHMIGVLGQWIGTICGKLEPQINVKDNLENIILILNVLNFKPVHIINHYFYVQ